MTSYFEALGASIGERVVADMVSSGRLDRMVENAVAETWEKMAGEVKYAAVREKLLAGAARIRAKQERHRVERKIAYDNLPWFKRWNTNFEEFCK